jgi:hypothetical protein
MLGISRQLAFTEAQRRELKGLSWKCGARLYDEQIEQLQESLRVCRSILSKPAALNDVRDKLDGHMTGRSGIEWVLR